MPKKEDVCVLADYVSIALCAELTADSIVCDMYQSISSKERCPVVPGVARGSNVINHCCDNKPLRNGAQATTRKLGNVNRRVKVYPMMNLIALRVEPVYLDWKHARQTHCCMDLCLIAPQDQKLLQTNGACGTRTLGVCLRVSG